MYRYSAFALNIESELDFPDLPQVTAEPDVTIRLGSVPRTRNKATMEDEFVFHRAAGGFHVRQGRSITVEPTPGVDPALLRVLLMGRIMAFLLRQRGWLPLHGSGVSIRGDGVLFLGGAGAGKSTTAAAFHSLGHQVITDDVAAVQISEGHCLARTGGSHIRLLEDAFEVFGSVALQTELQWDKHRLNLPREPVPDLLAVKKIFVLEYGDEVRAELISPSAAVVMLSVCSFVRVRRMDADALRIHMRQCAAVATAIRIHRLIRPRSMSALPRLCRLVEQELAFPA